METPNQKIRTDCHAVISLRVLQKAMFFVFFFSTGDVIVLHYGKANRTWIKRRISLLHARELSALQKIQSRSYAWFLDCLEK